MTEHDPLELELSTLQPHGLSTAVRNRIAERLSALPLEQAPVRLELHLGARRHIGHRERLPQVWPHSFFGPAKPA